MNKYLAIILISGKTIRTIVYADSPTHARLILEYQFGINSVLSLPVQVTNGRDGIPVEEVIAKIKPIKPLSPEQMRVKNLKDRVDQDKKRLQAEKDTQQQQRMLRRTHISM